MAKRKKASKASLIAVEHEVVRSKDVRRLSKMLARYETPKGIVEVLAGLCGELAQGDGGGEAHDQAQVKTWGDRRTQLDEAAAKL